MNEDAAYLAVALVALVVLAVVIVVGILYIRSIQLTLAAVDERHREIAPGYAWLLLIPLFNLVWMFILVSRIRRSFENLGRAGLLRRPTNASSDVGLALAICSVLSIIPYLGAIAGLVGFVLWIIYWNGIVKARAEIIQA